MCFSDTIIWCRHYLNSSCLLSKKIPSATKSMSWSDGFCLLLLLVCFVFSLGTTPENDQGLLHSGIISGRLRISYRIRGIEPVLSMCMIKHSTITLSQWFFFLLVMWVIALTTWSCFDDLSLQIAGVMGLFSQFSPCYMRELVCRNFGHPSTKKLHLHLGRLK